MQMYMNMEDTLMCLFLFKAERKKVLWEFFFLNIWKLKEIIRILNENKRILF